MSLSPWTEPLRARIESELTPIHNPRSRKKTARPAHAHDQTATAPPPEPATEPTMAATDAAN